MASAEIKIYDHGMLFRIIYVSSATAPFTDQQLDDLLQISRRNNLSADLTGMLLYKDGKFMQTLEGPAPAVRSRLEKIRSDPRHEKFTILMDGPILERSFESWSMGFKRITRETSINVPGRIDSDDFSLMSRRFLENPPSSLELLLAFKNETEQTATEVST